MAVKSIIDIEVKDDAFKRFHDLFQKYQEQLKDMPGDWGLSSEEALALGGTVAAQTAALLVQKQLLHDQAEAFKKQTKQEKDLLDLETKRRNIVKAIWQDTTKIANNIKSTTLDLFKWVGLGGIISGLAGAGGLFGFDALAHSVANSRRSALGLGVKTGEQQAANIAFGPYVDVNSTLEALANAQMDITQWVNFIKAGIGDYKNKSPTQLLPELLIRAKQLIDSGHGTVQDPRFAALLALGLTMDDVRRLHNIKMQELQDALNLNQKMAIRLNIDDKTNKAYQLFSVQLATSGQLIKNAFVVALAPLVANGTMTKFSQAIADVVTGLLGNPHMTEWITDFGKGLEMVATYLGSSQFQSDMKVFVDDVALLVKELVRALVYFDLIPDPNGPNAPGAPGGVGVDTGPAASRFARSPLGRGAALVDPHGSISGNLGAAINPEGNAELAKKLLTPGQSLDMAKKANALLGAMGWSGPARAGIIANLWSESTMNPLAQGDYVGKGANRHSTAYGLAQWHLHANHDAWEKEYMRLFGHTMESVRNFNQAFQEQIKFLNYDLTQGLSKNVGGLLAPLRTAGEFASQFTRGYERPLHAAADAASRAIKATILIKVFSPPGSNLHYSAAQLPQ